MQASKTDRSNPPARMYGVELYYEELPRLEAETLLEVLRARSPDMSAVPPLRPEGPWIFEHQDHQSGDGKTSARCVVGLSRQAPNLAALEPALRQSWSWPAAAEALAGCRGSVLVSDLLAEGLPHLERLILFERVLACLLEAYPCRAIHWQPTQQVIDAREFSRAFRDAGGLVFTPGPLNVRLFQILPETDGAEPSRQADVVMDTLGLATVGLPDVQCHFSGLDPQTVSRVLYNTGIYLMERGPVIDEEHTVPGPDAETKWLCRLEDSLALPQRRVVDLDPGPPHSARARR